MQREYQQIFEVFCKRDIKEFVTLIQSVKEFKESNQVLEMNNNAAWKLILKMLAKGNLFEEDRFTPYKLSGRRLIRESIDFFNEKLDN